MLADSLQKYKDEQPFLTFISFDVTDGKKIEEKHFDTSGPVVAYLTLIPGLPIMSGCVRFICFSQEKHGL